MVILIDKAGTQGAGYVDYAMGMIDASGIERPYRPFVIRGDVESTKELIRMLTHSQGFCSGALAFAESKIPLPVLIQIIDNQLEIMAPGLNPARLAAAYILHQKKKSLHTHFYIPFTELVTGARFTPYFHARDRRRNIWFNQVTNDRFLFADPNDPRYQRLLAWPRIKFANASDAEDRKARLAAEQWRHALIKQLDQAARAGQLASARAVDSVIRSAGWTIQLREDKRLVVVRPNLRAMELSGRLLGTNFGGFPTHEEMERASLRYRKNRVPRMAEAIRCLSLSMARRAEENSERFGIDFPGDQGPFLSKLRSDFELIKKQELLLEAQTGTPAALATIEENQRATPAPAENSAGMADSIISPWEEDSMIF